MWSLMNTPLDSLGNEVDSLMFFRQDSFAVTTTYEGKLAKLLLSKSGPSYTILFQSYTDSLYLHFIGTDGYEYFKVGVLGEFLASIDSIITFDNFTFVDFFTSLQNWYSVYRFAENVNQEYTIFSIDTTVTNDSLDLPLRFEYLGERLEDDTITTGIGTFGCKKFLIQQGVSIVFILPPPLPPIVQPLVFIEDTVWIAESNWIVQDILPTTHVDLLFIGIDPFFIPGLVREIIDPATIPVELISFSAVSEAGNVKLTWSTATETNNSGFLIERTTPQSPPWQGGEGEARGGWRKIGFVTGSGTATETQEYSYLDRTIKASTYFYRLKQIDFNGQFEYSEVIEVEVDAPLTFELSQNYPNPFNPSTIIKYQIPEPGFATLKVYDLLGSEIAILVNEEKPAGIYEVEFNATSATGGLPSGIYFYRLQVYPANGGAGRYAETKKMVLMK